jgi:putative Mg2+ transporter-C (MgtC) family protein
MAQEYFEISFRLLAALAAGGFIGLERSHRGRPAGFRTHALVCLASSLLMLVTVYESHWFPQIAGGRVILDPTRMAQGIMTGIGFLGAGVIFKEGLTIRGLTTSASIWVTAAIGILVGIGFYFPAAVGTIATILVLSLFRIVEGRLPSEVYAHHTLRFARETVLPEEELHTLLGQHGFTIANLSHRLTDSGRIFEYRMVIRSRSRRSAETLARQLRTMPEVVEFRIAPTGD